MGGIFAFPAMIDASIEPTGDANEKGINRIPAWSGDRPLTTENRWGIENTATVKGAPRKNAFLENCK